MNSQYVHVCTAECSPWHHSSKRNLKRLPWKTVDVHCHMFTELAETLVAGQQVKTSEPELLRRVQGAKSTEHNEKTVWPRSILKMSSLAERINDMDEMGVDVQIVSPSPTQYYYWAEDDLSENIVEAINENLVEQCSKHHERLMPMGTVSMQNPKLAVKQLKKCVQEYGMVGVEISNLINGVEISSAVFDEFWAQAESLKCPVFIHPLGTTLGERVNTHYLSNIIGQPLETTVTLAKLILEGVLDRYPELKIIAAHGGGYLPSYFGRLDHGYSVRPETHTCAKKPSDYLKQVWFDTVVYDPKILSHIISVVGVDQLLVGTDYPYDMGIDDVHKLISGLNELEPSAIKNILGRNALNLFGPLIEQWISKESALQSS